MRFPLLSPCCAAFILWVIALVIPPLCSAQQLPSASAMLPEEVHARLSFDSPLDSWPSSSADPAGTTHRFWDPTNDLLFAGVGASRAIDYSSTLNLRRRGDNEVFLNNSIVDNHPLFAGIEAAATAASIGVSYLFHRTGHHELERWTSIMHIGVALGGAARNYALPTQHPPQAAQ